MTHVKACRKGKITRLYCAFRKYGLENFSMTTLAESASGEQINDLEKIWILLLGSSNKEVGYNLTRGGDGGNTFGGRKHKEESILLMQQKATGKHNSEATKEKLRKRNQERLGPIAFRFNKSVSTELIIELYLGGKSTREIGREVGMEKTAIIGRLKRSGIVLRPSHRYKKAA